MAVGLTIAGYEVIDKVSQSPWHVLYLARQREGDAQVLLKIPRRSPPESADIELLQREYDLLATLSAPGIPRPQRLLRSGGACCLVLEDPHGRPLSNLISKGGADLKCFFELSIRVCAILGYLHRQDLVLHSLHPASILVNSTTGEVSLADLSLASRSSTTMIPPTLLVSVLPYVSPEQTGRMNRATDYRTDFYSLGIVLYELLTGAPPFLSEDPLELVHAHIARTPPAPGEIRSGIPEPVSKIIMKLLAKTAEERYQNALGIMEDLEHCGQEWSRRKAIAPFPLGRRDVSDRFLIPQKLYGRDLEVGELLRGFDRSCEGTAAMTLVAGYSGIGKTSMIQELYKPIVRERGYFISGKFDQVIRNVPFGAIIQAFRGLIRQLLTENEERLALWRTRLSEAFGANGSVLAEVLPEIRLIVGEQPPVPPLAPTEAQNRFRLVLQNFVAALASKDHPLVIFLDDLQWADPATLTILQPWLTTSDIRNLFLIGAYRDNEVDDNHPLARTLHALGAASAQIYRISLGPLSLTDLTLLVSDTLHCGLDEAEPLARLILKKTGGNPFFVIQFLRMLWQDGLLRFDPTTRKWEFQVETVAGAPMTDNVIDLMTRRIQRVSTPAQTALMLGACLGNQFDLHTLAIVSERPDSAVADDLKEALDEGLIFRTAESEAKYAFLHDRVQQAAYALIPDERKQLVHATAGRLMREQWNPATAEEKIFDVVHHLNLGSALLTDERERLALAKLNLTAGRKAKISTAYQAALGYFNAGLRLLSRDRWRSDYEIMLALHLEAAECEYLCGNFEKADQYFDLLLERAATRLDKAQVHGLRVVQFENMSRYADALSSGKEALALFGVTLPESADEKLAALETEIQDIQKILGSRSIASLIELPLMADPEIRMVMKILTALWAPSYLLGDQTLTRLISAAMVRLSLIHGNGEESAYGYVTHAITVGPVRGDYKSAYEFGKLALNVNDRLDDRKQRAKVHQQFNAHVNLWRRPMQTCIPHAREACRSGLETGDFTYANYGAFTESWAGFLVSRNLSQFVREYLPNLELIKKLRMNSFADAQKLILNWARALQNLSSSRHSLSTEDFDEEVYARTYQINPFFMIFYYVAKLHLHFSFGNYRKALDFADSARKIIHASGGTIWPVLLDFWSGLTLVSLYRDADEETRQSYWQELLRRREYFKTLADNSPENFGCFYMLLAAEMDRISHHPSEAADFYRQAIELAGISESPQNEALANELAAKFWLDQGEETAGAPCLEEAYRLYTAWGAASKVLDLEERYANLLKHTSIINSPRQNQALAQGPPPPLDISTVLKAARALTVEIELEGLLRKLIEIALENAGAQRGIFLQVEEAKLFIRAEGSVDHEVRIEPSVQAQGPVRFSQAIVNYVWKTGESVVIGDASADERFVSDPYIARAKPKSILCVALIHQGKPAGILYLENNLTTEAFTSRCIEMMRVLSAQAAISLEKAKLYEDMKQEVTRRQQAEKHNRALLEINNAIITNLTQDELFHSISEVLRPLLPFHRSTLILHEPETDVLRIAALGGRESAHYRVGTEIDRENSHARWVFDHKLPILRRDLAANRQYTAEHRLFTEGIRSLCTAPLIVRGRCIGTLSVLSENTNQYSDADVEFLQGVATQVALAVENMKSYVEISVLKGKLEAENVYLQEEIRHEHNFEEIVGSSPALLSLLRKVEQVAPTESTVLIYGETGTGKELIARAIHDRSNRKNRPLVKVNCGAIPAGLVESELFGHVKGAFTGAVGNRTGRFKLADGGTLFLDEIGELPLDMQVKLLRVLQEQEFEPVGSSETFRVDVRIIAASNRDLGAEVHEGKFRADLYYRLNVFPLTVPPLSSRRSDIPQLVTFFLARYAKQIGKKIETVSQETMNLLVDYSWPGNIRELQNVLQRAIVLSSGPILTLERDLLPAQRPVQAIDVPNAPVGPNDRHHGRYEPQPRDEQRGVEEPSTLDDAERRHIIAVMNQTRWVIEGPNGAARILNLHASTLRSRMKKLGISRPA